MQASLLRTGDTDSMPSERETRKLLINLRLQTDGRLVVEEAREGGRGRETPFGAATLEARHLPGPRGRLACGPRSRHDRGPSLTVYCSSGKGRKGKANRQAVG